MFRIECFLCLREVGVVLGCDDLLLWECIFGWGLIMGLGVFVVI